MQNFIYSVKYPEHSSSCHMYIIYIISPVFILLHNSSHSIIIPMPVICLTLKDI